MTNACDNDGSSCWIIRFYLKEKMIPSNLFLQLNLLIIFFAWIILNRISYSAIVKIELVLFEYLFSIRSIERVEHLKRGIASMSSFDIVKRVKTIQCKGDRHSQYTKLDSKSVSFEAFMHSYISFVLNLIRIYSFPFDFSFFVSVNS